VVTFEDVQLVALVTEQPDAADQFVKHTLGQLESAGSELQDSLRGFLEEGCNAVRTAARFRTHRNTLLRRCAGSSAPKHCSRDRSSTIASRSQSRWKCCAGAARAEHQSGRAREPACEHGLPIAPSRQGDASPSHRTRRWTFCGDFACDPRSGVGDGLHATARVRQAHGRLHEYRFTAVGALRAKSAGAVDAIFECSPLGGVDGTSDA
jgi:hypothetical protein